MQLIKTLLIAVIPALVKPATAAPVPVDLVEADIATNNTIVATNIEARDGIPPRNTNMADGITMFDLPNCYQDCMRREDGKASIHMGKDSLDQYCRTKRVMIDWWLEHNVRPCVKKACKAEKNPHGRAREWYKAVCGRYPYSTVG